MPKIVKKKDWKVTTNFQDLGLETVARHIAKAEGKDEKAIEAIKNRIRGGR